ncbi:hypothetical protein Pelo_4143 [Pelomyxa schiedti]|nr:hypothetical protein Pelo_4143 [Pelomyxa schiedti]
MNEYFMNMGFYLLLVYSTVTLVIIFQISRIIYHKHDLFSLANRFFLLCLVWCLLRDLFFADIEFWLNTCAYMVIYGLPMIIQFSTFSLLVYYFASGAHYASWEAKTRKIALTSYISANIFFFITLNVLFAMSIYYWFEYPSSSSQSMGSNSTSISEVVEVAPVWLEPLVDSFYGLMFFVLVVVLLCYGIMIRNLHSPNFPPSPTTFTMFIVSMVIFVIFTTRSLWDILEAVPSFTLLTIDEGTVMQIIAQSLLFVWWEIVPISLVLLLFWRIPSHAVREPTKQHRPYIGALPEESSYGIPSTRVKSESERLLVNPDA